MQEKNQQFKEQLERFRSGRSGAAERSRIFRWLLKLNLYGEVKPELLSEKQHLAAAKLEAKIFPETPTRKRGYPAWIGIAAAITLLLSTVLLWQYFPSGSQTESATQWVHMRTEAGEMRKIILSDSTEIILNGLSTLTYPTQFSRKSRLVKLSGQGFFNVSHHPERPFKVQTGKVLVQVLGTSFDVMAYSGEPGIHVGVATGRVAVTELDKSAAAPHFLTPGQGLVYHIAEAKFSPEKINIKELGAWQERIIVLREVSLEEITNALHRQYKVKFIYKHAPLKQKRLSLNVRNATIENIMEGLSISGGFKYKIEKRTITIMPM